MACKGQGYNNTVPVDDQLIKASLQTTYKEEKEKDKNENGITRLNKYGIYNTCKMIETASCRKETEKPLVFKH